MKQLCDIPSKVALSNMLETDRNIFQTCFNRVPRASLVMLAWFSAEHKSPGPISDHFWMNKC